MDIRYGQLLQVKENVDMTFMCDGILPAGQSGYTEKHYKIRFGSAVIKLPERIVLEMFEEYKVSQIIVEEPVSPVNEVIEESANKTNDLSKLKKDELIHMVHTALPDKDCSSLKKDELIKILEGPTNA
jgi:hypothetical protein